MRRSSLAGLCGCRRPDSVREFKLSKKWRQTVDSSAVRRSPVALSRIVVHTLSRSTQHSHEGELDEHIPDSCSDDIVSHRDR